MESDAQREVLEAAASIGVSMEELLRAEPESSGSKIAISPALKSLAAGSAVLARSVRREQYALIAEWPPALGGRSEMRWPFTHPLTPSPTGFGDEKTPDYLIGPEAEAFFTCRASACTEPRLRATHALLAFLTATGKSKLAAADLCVNACLAAFDVAIKASTAGNQAGPFLVRAFMVAKSIKSVPLADRVQHRAVEYLKTEPSAYVGAVRDIVFGIAERDPGRTALPYTQIADAALASAERHQSLQTLERPSSHALMEEFGRAYSCARYTKDQDRILKAGRALVSAKIRRSEDTNQTTHKHHWLRAAAATATEFEGAEDLLEQIKIELQRLAPTLGKDLPSIPQKIEIPRATVETLEAIRAEIVAAGDHWQFEMVRSMVLAAKPVSPEETPEESLLRLLMSNRKTEAGRNISYDTTAETRIAENIERLLIPFLWRFVMRPGLTEVHAAGRLTPDHLLGPLLARQISADDFPYLVSATGNLLQGDFIAATQGWVLALERLIRAGVVAGGGTTTSLGRSDSEEHEVSIEAAIEALEVARPVDPSCPVKNLCLLLKYFLGWRGPGLNLRNKVAHGTLTAGECQPFTAYVGYLLALGVSDMFLPIRTSEAENAGASERPESGSPIPP